MRDAPICHQHYKAKLRERVAKGEWVSGWVPVEEILPHIERLHAAGVCNQRMAELTGMNVDAFHRITKGQRRRVQAMTAKRIMEIAIPTPRRYDTDNPKAKIPHVGTARRLQALIAIGYGQFYMADRLGLCRTTLDNLVHERRKSVNLATAKLIDKLFRELQLTHAPESQGSRRMRKMAEKNGWPPPLYWDEESIDDPNAVPYTPAKKSKFEWYEEYEELIAMGLNNIQIAERLGIHRDTLQKKLARYRDQAVA